MPTAFSKAYPLAPKVRFTLQIGPLLKGLQKRLTNLYHHKTLAGPFSARAPQILVYLTPKKGAK